MDLPPWLPSELWQEFRRHRQKLRKPMTEYAEKLIIKRLQAFKDQGFNPTEIVETSIERGWQGVFLPAKPVKNERWPSFCGIHRNIALRQGVCPICEVER